jgi:hypothetical protein
MRAGAASRIHLPGPPKHGMDANTELLMGYDGLSGGLLQCACVGSAPCCFPDLLKRDPLAFQCRMAPSRLRFAFALLLT